MSEQPRSSDPSERPETLVERLKALSAKWRDAAMWQFDQCADELDAEIEKIASRAVPSTGEAPWRKAKRGNNG